MDSSNIALWQKLKEMPSEEVDQLFHPIAMREEESYDCTQCGRCCKTLQPPCDSFDQTRLRNEVSEPSDYLVWDQRNQIHYLKSKPCYFLKGKMCSVYSSRPESCRSYPHLQEPHIKFRKRSIMSNYSICPIVYNSIETLKSALDLC